MNRVSHSFFPARNASYAAIALATLALSACATPTRTIVSTPINVGQTAKVPRVVPAGSPATLVWTRDAAGATRTYRLDEAGSIVASMPGVRIATSAGEWTWRADPIAIKTTACPHYDDNGNELPADAEPEPGTATRATLTHAGQTQDVISADDESAQGAESFEHSVELVGSVGPILFVRQSTYAYTCGAHGNVNVSAIAWDAERGVMVDFGDAVDDPTLREQAFESLKDDDDSTFASDSNEVSLTEVVPQFSKQGTLTIAAKYSAPTCYACSDGESSSYTKSKSLPTRVMPSALSDFRSPPSTVQAFLAANPDVELGGWSYAR